MRARRQQNPRWLCPRCGVMHAPELGQPADMFLDWGQVWRPAVCVARSGHAIQARRWDSNDRHELDLVVAKNGGLPNAQTHEERLLGIRKLSVWIAAQLG